MQSDIEKQPLLDGKADTEPAPSLGELQQRVRDAQSAYLRAWSRPTSSKWHKRVMSSVTVFLLLFMIFCLGVIWLDDDMTDRDGWPAPAKSSKVPLEAHIMSKCPDAKDCLHDLVLPAMQKISDKVDFKLSYIGTTDYDGVKCMHGQEECLGNMIELCAEKLYPDPKIYLGFVMCLTRDYQHIPDRELVADCALEHSMSMDRLNDCMSEDDGANALDMLRDSFNRTAEAGVTKSCTVRLNGEIRCIRDGGEWKDCKGGSRPKDLIKDVKDLYPLGWE